AAVAATCTCSRTWAQEEDVGCGLTASAAASFARDNELLASSGNATIDTVFPAERAILDAAFLVQPDFSFYDDSSGPNAFATTTNIFGTSPHGTVCFGVNLLSSEMSQHWWGAAIAGIGAHEWAH